MSDQERISTRRAHHKQKRLRAHVDTQEMTVTYGRVKLGVPNGFKTCLENVTREILRDQPRDIPAYLALYFTELAADQKNGMQNSNLVTKRIVEVNTNMDQETQKDVEKIETAEAKIETQDIEDTRSLREAEQEQAEAEAEAQVEAQAEAPTETENPETTPAQIQPSNLSFEEQQRLEAEQNQQLSFEEQEALNQAEAEQNFNAIESEPQLVEAPVEISEEQQKALDLLNHVGDEEAQAAIEAEKAAENLEQEAVEAEAATQAEEAEVTEDQPAEPEPSQSQTEEESKPLLTNTASLPTFSNSQDGNKQASKSDQDLPSNNQAIQLTSESNQDVSNDNAALQEVTQSVSHISVDKLPSDIITVNAEVIVDESIMELVNESKTQVDQIIEQQEQEPEEDQPAAEEPVEVQEQEQDQEQDQDQEPVDNKNSEENVENATIEKIENTEAPILDQESKNEVEATE